VVSLCAPKISRTWSAVTLRVRLVTYTMGFFTGVGLRRRLVATRRLRCGLGKQQGTPTQRHRRTWRSVRTSWSGCVTT
jgi:hypothetical protein